MNSSYISHKDREKGTMVKDKSQDIGIVSQDSINAAFNVFTSIGEEERPQIIGLSGLGLG